MLRLDLGDAVDCEALFALLAVTHYISSCLNRTIDTEPGQLGGLSQNCTVLGNGIKGKQNVLLE